MSPSGHAADGGCGPSRWRPGPGLAAALALGLAACAAAPPAGRPAAPAASPSEKARQVGASIGGGVQTAVVSVVGGVGGFFEGLFATGADGARLDPLPAGPTGTPPIPGVPPLGGVPFPGGGPALGSLPASQSGTGGMPRRIGPGGIPPQKGPTPLRFPGSGGAGAATSGRAPVPGAGVPTLPGVALPGAGALPGPGGWTPGPGAGGFPASGLPGFPGLVGGAIPSGALPGAAAPAGAPAPTVPVGSAGSAGPAGAAGGGTVWSLFGRSAKEPDGSASPGTAGATTGPAPASPTTRPAVPAREDHVDVTPELARQATAVARKWRPDATLMEVTASQVDRDPMAAARNPGAPRQLVPVAAFVFTSPSRPGGGYTVQADRAGKLTPAPFGSSQAEQPLPATFLPLGQALARARQQGFRDTLYYAQLKFHGAAAGWHFRGMSGGDQARDLVIDAGTGGTSTMHEASGAGARERLVAEMATPRPVATPAPYATLRAVADQAAARWGRALRLAQVDLAGVRAGGRLVASRADFHYLGAPDASGRVERVRVRIADGQASASVVSSDFVVDGPGVPRPLPGHALSPDDALKRFAALGPVTDQEVVLQELHVATGRELGHGPFEGRWLAGVHRPELTGRFVWRLHRRPVVSGGAGIAGGLNATHAEYTYIDAVTGEKL